MNLLEIRTRFIKQSGRYDLVTDPTTFADNGANFFINAGQKAIDRMLGMRGTRKVDTVTLDAEDYEVTLTGVARIIENVYVDNGSTDGALRLTYRSHDWLQYELGGLLPILTSGTPIYWTYKEPFETTLARKLYIVPATEASCTIRVEGQFLTADLQDLTGDEEEGDPLLDRSYWTLYHPELLIKAALWQLEVFYRNTEGAKDWARSIQEDIQLLDMDDVADISSQINVMEG